LENSRSPLPAARAPEELRPHPALRLHGQLSTFHVVRTLPPAVENGAGSSSPGNGFDNFGAVVYYLSDAIDCCREIDGGSDCLAIRFEMLCRYVVGEIPNRTDDVRLHADGEVRLHAAGPLRSCLNTQQKLSHTHDSSSRIRLRLRFAPISVPLPATRSTRKLLLSP
jgi:hypothetical protein